VAVPQRTASRGTADRVRRRRGQAAGSATDDPMAGPRTGRIQNRGQPGRGSSVGLSQEPARHELRQTVPESATVLQKRNHAEDGTFAASRLSVLSSVQRVKTLSNFPKQNNDLVKIVIISLHFVHVYVSGP